MLFEENRVFCPICNNHRQLLRISRAARIADVSRRTIYNYIEEGAVFSIRLAGKTLRVCSGCLLKSNEESCVSGTT
jgi:predicted transcriptional regulator